MILSRAGVRAAQQIPAESWISLNVSMDLLAAGQALPNVLALSPRPVVLEVKASDVTDVQQFKELIGRYPDATVALTGVAATYDALTLISELSPRYVKLERSWVTGLATDQARQALVTALVTLSQSQGSGLIAEGIEQPDELSTLRDLGVQFGQGFLLGRPSRVPSPAAT
jgi:EAL domain-containing protein (putative c-di-GMP-specific phosphodiesterase class I)